MDLFNRDIPNLPELVELKSQLEELVGVCAQLKKENESLRDKHQMLIEKNEQARARVESIVERLKSIEELQ